MTTIKIVKPASTPPPNLRDLRVENAYLQGRLRKLKKDRKGARLKLTHLRQRTAAYLAKVDAGKVGKAEREALRRLLN